MNKKFLILLIFVSRIFATPPPPPVPGAGVVEREIEREYEAKPLEQSKEVPAIQIDMPEKRIKLPDGKKIVVTDIYIKGNEAISSNKLKCLTKRYINKKISLRNIYELCHSIDRFYAKKGYFLARAYPPAQAIDKGVLVIEIIEGKLGNIRVVGNHYYTEKFIRSYFTSLRNQPLNYKDFLYALMLVNDNSDLKVGAVFEKGKDFGFADVILQVVDSRCVHLYLNGNNFGRNLTTNTRTGGRIDVGNVFTQGDKLSFTEVIGFPIKALYFTDIIYDVPLNRQGASLEIAYLFSRFKIEELSSLQLKGRSDIGTLRYNQALVRRRYLSLDFFSYFDIKQIQNFALSERTSYDKLRVLSVGTLLDHFNPCKGRDYAVFRLAAGIPHFLGGLKSKDSECSRPGGGGKFFVFNFDYDKIQNMFCNSFFYFHGSLQLSPSKLPVPEQIYIGGADTVRGFPLATFLGDSGYYLNLEYRFPPLFLANKYFFKSRRTKWKDIIQLDGFLDNGGVFLKSEKNLFLWGSGVGAKVMGPCNFAFSFDIGFPLNHRSFNRKSFTYIKLTWQPF